MPVSHTYEFEDGTFMVGHSISFSDHVTSPSVGVPVKTVQALSNEEIGERVRFLVPKANLLNVLERMDSVTCHNLNSVPKDYLADAFEEAEPLYGQDVELDQMIDIVRDYFRGRYESPREKTKKKPTPGFIYLLKSDNGLYKIGRTKDIVSRVKAIQKEFPIKIEMVHNFFARDYITREKDLHLVFDDKRQGNSEWFALEPEDVEVFLQLSDEGDDGEDNA